MMVEYHQTVSPEIKDVKKKNIITHVVNQWALNNGLLCGVIHNPSSLASYLGCDIEDINMVLRERLLNNRIWDKQNQEEILNSITGMSISMAMEDRMEAASQVEILKRSQGDHYVPFISAELRQALDLKMKAGAQLSSMIKNIMGGTTNVFNINNQSSAGVMEQNNFVTKEDALKILEEEHTKQKESFNEKDAKFLEEHYELDALPDVSAKTQQGLDVTKEGLDAVKTELIQITDNYKIHREEPEDVDFHEIRREFEMNIDSEDDPEMDNYN